MPRLILTPIDDTDFTSVLARINTHLIPDPPPPTQEEQAARKTAAWTRRATLLGVPPRLQPASFATSTPTPALHRTREFLATEAPQGRCLLLCGPTGVGKSYAAAAALRDWRQPGGQFLYWPDLCAKLLHHDSYQGAIAAATATALVVFDDFGAEYLKDGGLLAAHLDSIVWCRHAYFMPTIITSNLTPEQFHQRFSDRILDRLTQEWTSIYVMTHHSLRT